MSIEDLDDSERTPCEVWSRVMGYHRPVDCFNDAKKAEFRDRRFYEESTAVERMAAA